MATAKSPDQFALNEYRDYITYRELAKTEPFPEFRKILEALVAHELEDYRFWVQFSSKRNHKISSLEVWCIKAMRRILGLTFTAKFLERHEHEAIRNYTAFLKDANETIGARVQNIISHEMLHERKLISQIKEERVKFLGSIVLGINDGLIELTGALVGFAFAMRDHFLVALLGAVTGIAACLSMAASAYMQARYDQDRSPKKAALYTGTSYAVVVAVLVLPFFLIPNIYIALGAMFAAIFLMIVSFSLYSSVLFERNFKRQLGEMFLFSAGVGMIAFLLGSLIRPMMAGPHG